MLRARRAGRQRLRAAARQDRRVHRRGADVGDRALPVLRGAGRVDAAHAGARRPSRSTPRSRPRPDPWPRCRCSSRPESARDRQTISIAPRPRPRGDRGPLTDQFREVEAAGHPARTVVESPVGTGVSLQGKGGMPVVAVRVPAPDPDDLWRLTMEHSLIGMAIVSTDGVVVAANRRALRHARLRARRAEVHAFPRSSPTPTTSSRT